MAIRKIEKAEWHPFFDWVSKMIEGKRAEIEVASLSLGDQVEAEWLPLWGIVYDPKDDIIEIALEDVDHIIYHPREVYMDDGGVLLASLEIIAGDGTRQIVKLREPLMLPAPAE